MNHVRRSNRVAEARVIRPEFYSSVDVAFSTQLSTNQIASCDLHVRHSHVGSSRFSYYGRGEAYKSCEIIPLFVASGGEVVQRPEGQGECLEGGGNGLT